jgi:TonB family protein
VNDALKLSSDGIIKMNELCGRTQRTAYDPPEAASMTTSAAGDIWSLGVVLVEALTQKLPSFNGSESGNGKASDPEISASLPEPFQEIIRNCLRTDPERRWSVDRIASRLEIASVHDSTESPDTGPRPSASRRYLVLLIVVLAIAVTGVIIMHGSHNSSGLPASDQTASDQATSPAAQSTQPESSQPALPRSAQNDAGQNEGRTPSAAVNSSPPSQTNAGRKLSVKMSDSVNAPTQGVIHELIPAVPLSARRTIHGKVRVQVRVEVNPSGDVTAVKFISPGPSKYFARIAQTAAQQWKFVPLQTNGQNVASAWMLKFAFGREATQVSPARAD